MFLDESGFLLIPTVRRTWAPRGHTPLVRHRYRRDKISAISAVTLSARRRRLGLYLHFHPDQNITHVEVARFLRALLRHLRGHVIVLWDGGPIRSTRARMSGRCARGVPVSTSNASRRTRPNSTRTNSCGRTSSVPSPTAAPIRSATCSRPSAA